LEFLYWGALAGDPGILVVFEERAQAVRQHAHALGWDLAPLEQAGKLFVLEGAVDPAAILAGDFDLQALLAIIAGRSQALGARRIVIDAVDVLTRLYRDPWREQSELYTLHRWLADREMTTIFTMKVLHYQGPLAGYEFLDFMADCVIKLDQRSNNQVSTRRLQVIKYRRASFGRNEYPYIIAEDGIHLLAVSSVVLTKQAPGDVGIERERPVERNVEGRLQARHLRVDRRDAGYRQDHRSEYVYTGGLREGRKNPLPGV
jgi:circadian clock protein KaiC